MLLVAMDYKDLEGLVAAVLAGQEDYIEAYKAGVDHHQALADKLGITRKQAKVLNHSVRYGRSAYTIGLDLEVSKEEAQKLIDQYWKVNNKVAAYKASFIREAKRAGQFKTALNTTTVKVMPGAKDDQIYATMIQGSGADVVKVAMVKCYRYLKENKAGRIMLNMHDQLVFAVTDKKHIPKLKEIMETAAKGFPLNVEVTVGSF